MFIQVIKGRVKDADAMRAAGDRWQAELQPGAKGWLGITSGVADDGTYVAVVRFESQEAAEANAARPEQSSWWEETSKLFDGAPAFYDCPEVDVMGGGGSNDAGFVQLMIYKPKDVEALRKAVGEFEKHMPNRPDLIGGTTAFATDGTVIDTNYFTSEAAAREGEKGQMPAGMQEAMETFRSNAGEITFVDLRDPVLA